jgi:hypothetical protein
LESSQRYSGSIDLLDVMRLMNLHTGIRRNQRLGAQSGSLGLELSVWVVLVAFVGANLAARLHQIVQEHVRCAEHGELIHVADSSDGDASAVIRAVEHSMAGRMAEATPHVPANDGHEHEHCHFVVPSREHEGALSATYGLPGMRADARPLPPAHAIERPQDQLYSLAPKTSPPA